MHIAEGFVQQAQRHPEKPAVMLQADLQRTVACSYGDLLQSAQQITRAIGACTKPGSNENSSDVSELSNDKNSGNRISNSRTCVGLLLPNGKEFLEIFLGTTLAGAVAIVLDPKWTPVQICSVLRQHPLDVLFVESAQLSHLAAYFTELPKTPKMVVLNFATGKPEGTAPDWIDQIYGVDSEAPLSPGLIGNTDPFYVGFTAGTTGQPKGVVRSHASWVHSFAASRIEFGTADSDRILVPGSLVHSLSLYAALECLNAGATLYLLPQFSARAALTCLQTQNITMLVAVPTLLKTIAKVATNRQQIYASPRAVIAGGSKLMPDLRTTLPQIFPNADVLEYFGALELSFISLASSREPVPAQSVGRPFQGVALSIQRFDGAGAAEPGETGWIGVKSPMLSSGYWSLPASDITGYRIIDGWATVGDLGWLDANGYLYLVGREQDMLVSGGINIYPAEIEAILQSFPEIDEVAVFGIPDADRGQAIGAAIRWSGQPLTRSTLQQRLQPLLPRAKYPRHFFSVDQFPRTNSGKIIRAALREQLLGSTSPYSELK